VARALGATPDALGLAAALAQPFADVVLLGAATVAQLRSNLAALALAPRLGADALGALAPLAEPPGAYWGRRAAMPWG
jgi:aryl-alcohol dehydrogenase-like predicted oxidoreductase